MEELAAPVLEGADETVDEGREEETVFGELRVNSLE
jgi:hypothetical protein